jgi:hypothetical protein
VAINYSNVRRKEVRVPRDRLGPIVAVILVVGGLLWLGPQSAKIFERATTALKLPTY